MGMQKHSHRPRHAKRNSIRNQSRKSHPKTTRPTTAPHDDGFLAAWKKLLDGFGPTLSTRRGRKPRVPLVSLLAALVFHLMNPTGTLAEHFAMLFDDALCDSSCASRRARLPWEVFAELMRRTLRPHAQKRRHPESFWRGWLLVALDGVQFSLSNTPQVKASAKKAKSRRGKAAFAKIVSSVLLELGHHNPLAAAIGRQGESEWALARTVVAQLPPQALLLADRLHGCAAFVAELLPICERVGSHFLIRARTQIKAHTVRRLKDGSRIVRVPVRQKGQPRVIVQKLDLREIRVRVQRPGHRVVELRLWTDLLDAEAAPAMEMVELYAQRWEQELFYRQLKHQLRRGEVLGSHTVETGAQEIAAMMVAAALLAEERARAANGEVPVLRVSFGKLLELLRPLWLVLALGADILEEWQKEEMSRRFYEQARQCLTPKRRRRSCPRAVRQPVSGWPRLLKNESWTGSVNITIR